MIKRTTKSINDLWSNFEKKRGAFNTNDMALNLFSDDNAAFLSIISSNYHYREGEGIKMGEMHKKSNAITYKIIDEFKYSFVIL